MYRPYKQLSSTYGSADRPSAPRTPTPEPKTTTNAATHKDPRQALLDAETRAASSAEQERIGEGAEAAPRKAHRWDVEEEEEEPYEDSDDGRGTLYGTIVRESDAELARRERAARVAEKGGRSQREADDGKAAQGTSNE